MKFTMVGGTWIKVPAELIDPPVTKKPEVVNPRLDLLRVLLVANHLEQDLLKLRS